MTRPSDERTHDVILDVVLELLESGGYDAVKLHEVAKRARVSLATIYKTFRTRDELILSAVERWMNALVYREMAMPRRDDSLYEVLMRSLRTVFEPWERHPRMLEAFHRARTGPGGERLAQQGLACAQPLTQALRAKADPEYVRDVGAILGNVVYGLIGRFTDGQIAIRDILPALERAVFRLTAGYRPARSSRRGRARKVD